MLNNLTRKALLIVALMYSSSSHVACQRVQGELEQDQFTLSSALRDFYKQEAEERLKDIEENAKRIDTSSTLEKFRLYQALTDLPLNMFMYEGKPLNEEKLLALEIADCKMQAQHMLNVAAGNADDLGDVSGVLERFKAYQNCSEQPLSAFSINDKTATASAIKALKKKGYASEARKTLSLAIEAAEFSSVDSELELFRKYQVLSDLPLNAFEIEDAPVTEDDLEGIRVRHLYSEDDFSRRRHEKRFVNPNSHDEDQLPEDTEQHESIRYRRHESPEL